MTQWRRESRLFVVLSEGEASARGVERSRPNEVMMLRSPTL